MRRVYRCAAVLRAVLTLLLAGPAFAHAEEEQGDITFAVGFAVEPAYAGQPNACPVARRARTKRPSPTSRQAICRSRSSFGDQTTTLDVEPEFEVGEWGTPGDYRAPFIPSEPGPYTFHVTGNVDGEKVDFSMTSGPETFSEVAGPRRGDVPGGRRRRPTTDLAARVDAESARLADRGLGREGCREPVATRGDRAVIVGDRGVDRRDHGPRPFEGSRRRMTPLLAHAGGTDETLSLVMLFAGLWVGWIGWSRLRGTGFDRMPRAAAWGLIAGAVALVAAASFVPRALLGPKNAAAVTGPRPRSTATLAFAEPQPDASTGDDQMTVQLDLRGGTITAVTSTSVAPDTGHIHLSLDGALVSMLR